MYEVIRLVLAGIARYFVENKFQRSEHYFWAEDLVVEDEVALPDGKVIRVTIEYVDEPEPDDP